VKGEILCKEKALVGETPLLLLVVEDTPHEDLMGVKATTIKGKLVVERLAQSKTKKGTQCILVSDFNIRRHATLGWPASPTSIQGQTLLRQAMAHLAPTQLRQRSANTTKVGSSR